MLPWCLQALIDWGVSIDATNEIDGESGATCLHIAAKYAAVDAATYLLGRNANINAKQSEGLTPIQCAISQANQEAGPGMSSPKHMEVIKVLLRHGAKITSADHATGLAAAVREVQYEALTAMLREAAPHQVSVKQLEEADAAVKAAMLKHLELVEQREKAKAGSQLIELETAIQAEMAETQKVRDRSAELQLELNEKQIVHEGARKEFGGIDKDFVALQDELATLEAHQATLTEELEEQRAEMTETGSKLEELQTTRTEAENANIEAQARYAEWESEVEASRTRAAEIKAEVRAARGELRAYLKDKEAAHRLTEQAKQVLGR